MPSRIYAQSKIYIYASLSQKVNEFVFFDIWLINILGGDMTHLYANLFIF